MSSVPAGSRSRREAIQNLARIHFGRAELLSTRRVAQLLIRDLRRFETRSLMRISIGGEIDLDSSLHLVLPSTFVNHLF
jgi:hypothetical protein